MTHTPFQLLHATHLAGLRPSLIFNNSPSRAATDALHASFILFPDPAHPSRTLKFATSDPSGFKDYNVGTLVHAYDCKDQSFGDYLKMTGGDGRMAFVDRKEMVAVLGGKVGEGMADGERGNAAKRSLEETAAGSSTAGGAGLDTATAPGRKKPRISLAPEEVEFIRRVKERERVIGDVSDPMVVGAGSKDFSNIIELSRKRIADLHRKVDPKTKGVAPSSSSSSRPDPRRGATTQARPTPHAKSSRHKTSDAPIPIIIVPSAPTARLTLWNVKQFLADTTYIPTQKFIDDGVPKPTQLTFERTLRSGHPGAGVAGFPRTYLVVDNADGVRMEDWPRVVGAFVTGQTWQFSRWKYRDPMLLFNKVKGFCLKYVDEAPPGDVDKWPVTKLDVNRNTRHNDYTAVNKFWEGVDALILGEKRGVFFE
ncbi:RNA pol II accessory factor, Cdc73 family-domain-containing protein [Fimicolochytrium jonesii]|uniref:RNA pol II accessory factor, Cdc73 family-domain-containing protein n=1 Tax=Fimicolochytrium jonesii TaxID=1396493 RepID=UPI0022FDB2C7|nr:RNA pol II accessory factor, Cdc73 family-domain-containing protein [Fimicolochytrium jonesii]KAI8815622.1 RNA pol II accessory factor, Cdc73 family-domain-containing protein [Fimicolochytrium jonesii]